MMDALLELIFHGIFHPIGWAMLKVLTPGRYSPPKPADYNRELVAGFPLLILLVAVAIAFA